MTRNSLLALGVKKYLSLVATYLSLLLPPSRLPSPLPSPPVLVLSFLPIQPSASSIFSIGLSIKLSLSCLALPSPLSVFCSVSKHLLGSFYPCISIVPLLNFYFLLNICTMYAGEYRKK